MLAALILDLHGTLVDDEPLRFALVAELAAAEGFSIEPERWAARYAGMDDRSVLAVAWADAGRAPSPDALRRLHEARVRAYVARAFELAPHAGARALVEEAAKRLPIAVVASSSRAEAQAALKATGLFGSLSALVCAEELGRAHPSVHAYGEALARLNAVLVRARREPATPRQVLAVEDTEGGIAAARAAGMRVAAVGHTQPAQRLEAADVRAARLVDLELARLERELF